MTPDSPKRQYVSDWWWRAPLFVAFATQTVLLMTNTDHTTVGHTVQVVLFAVALTASFANDGVDWILRRRHRKATEHEPREMIDP